LTETTGFMSPHNTCGGAAAGAEFEAGFADGPQADARAAPKRAIENLHLSMH
jgi:hypothetical protein